MKKVRFTIDVGIVGGNRYVEEEFEDDVTEEELQDYANELVWDYVSVSYDEA